MYFIGFMYMYIIMMVTIVTIVMHHGVPLLINTILRSNKAYYVQRKMPYSCCCSK